MNFLAHIYLSYEDEELMVGNFLADFIKNRDLKHYSKRIQDGIYLHRKIDSFTDNHLIVRQGTKRLQSKHHKYSPVIVDIFYDYLLVNNWEKYADHPISEFASNVYDILDNRMEIMPTMLKKRLPMMIADNWLVRYGLEEGLKFTFERMKRRVSYPQYFENVVDSLLTDYEAFKGEFNLFFPDVIEYVKKEKKDL